MREFRSTAQSRELRIGLGRIGTNQFDGGALAGIGQLGEENGAVVRAAEIEDETVSSVDNLAFLLFPGVGHLAPAAFEWRAEALHPIEENYWALGKGYSEAVGAERQRKHSWVWA